MKKKNIIWLIATLLLGTPIFLVYLTFSNSTDCSQLVIDTYELHSGINIPEVKFVNSYYDEHANTRISIYELNAQMDLSNFKRTKFTSGFLHGISLLDESELPNERHLYLASGEKWGTKWTYLVDSDSRRLWAELKYDK
jgi:hypothetical protein